MFRIPGTKVPMKPFTRLVAMHGLVVRLTFDAHVTYVLTSVKKMAFFVGEMVFRLFVEPKMESASALLCLIS